MSVSGRFEDLVPLRPWEMTWNGRTWRDMPGGDETMQKCAFALYRRGLLDSEESDDPDDVVESGMRRLVPVKRGGGANRVGARLSEEQREKIAAMEEKRQEEEALRRLQGKLQMRLTKWGQQRGAMEQIATRARVDSGSLCELRMTGRKIAGERAERVAKALDELDAGTWALKVRMPRRKTVYEVPEGCVPFKAWLDVMAERLGMEPHSVRCRAIRGQLDLPEIVKLNGRKWFVRREALEVGAEGAGVSVSQSPSLKVSKSERRAA